MSRGAGPLVQTGLVYQGLPREGWGIIGRETLSGVLVIAYNEKEANATHSAS